VRTLFKITVLGFNQIGLKAWLVNAHENRFS